MDTKKKMAAAMAAVMAYIKSEEESICTAPPVVAPSPIWGMTGRLAQAQMRSMMQVRALK